MGGPNTLSPLWIRTLLFVKYPTRGLQYTKGKGVLKLIHSGGLSLDWHFQWNFTWKSLSNVEEKKDV